MDNREALKICVEEGIRFDAIIPVVLSCANWVDDGLSDVFSETFYDDWLSGAEPADAAVQPLLKCLPEFTGLLAREDFDELEAGHVADWMIENGHHGILAMVSTPVRTYFPGDTGNYTYSWGCTTQTWLYGQTLEDLFLAAGQWVEGKAEAWIAKATEG